MQKLGPLASTLVRFTRTTHARNHVVSGPPGEEVGRISDRIAPRAKPTTSKRRPHADYLRVDSMSPRCRTKHCRPVRGQSRRECCADRVVACACMPAWARCTLRVMRSSVVMLGRRPPPCSVAISQDLTYITPKAVAHACRNRMTAVFFPHACGAKL